MSACTSAWLFKQVHALLVYLQEAVSSFYEFTLLPLLLLFKHFLIAQVVFGYPLGIDGSGPIWMIKR
jgi:hypothetical protein